MRLAAGMQMNPAECAVLCELKCWNIDLCQMYVNFSLSMNPGNIALVDDW